MISNSVKALKGVPDKTIKCSGYISENDLILSMSDNGIGIPLEKGSGCSEYSIRRRRKAEVPVSGCM